KTCKISPGRYTVKAITTLDSIERLFQNLAFRNADNRARPMTTEQAQLPKLSPKPFRRYKREQARISRHILYPVTAFYTLYSIIMMFVAFRTKHPFIA